MMRFGPIPARRILAVALMAVLVAGLAPAASAQAPEGWIRIEAPREWSGEVVRGIAVVPRNSIRIEGRAFQPGGVSRVEIEGRAAQLAPQSGGEVRFVGYADTDSAARTVEVTVYSAAASAPVVREYPYTPAVGVSPAAPEEAWSTRFDGERYAVVIGISEYQDPGIGSLRYADDDAEAFHEFLLSESAGLGGFEPQNVRLLTNEEADTRSVRTALTTFLRGVTEQDVVFIYLAGHGAPDPFRPSDYYLLTHDTEASNFAGTAISMQDIDTYVRRLRARDVVLLTDACHSAAVSSSGIRAGPSNQINQLFLERLSATGAGFFTFTASETNQYSQEGPQWGGGHGVFTHQLLESLRGAGDADRDGIVTLGEMIEYTRSTVIRETQNAQVPFVGPGSFDRSWPMAIAEGSAVGLTVEGPSAPAAPVAAVAQMSPVGVLAHSLLLPGTGQFRTGRGWRGALVLGGAAAAIGYGFLSTRVTMRCQEATVGGECLSGQFTSTSRERPNLVAGIAAAGALTLLGAVDAWLGARSVNRSRREAAGLQVSADHRFILLPSAQRNGPFRSGDVRLMELRFR